MNDTTTKEKLVRYGFFKAMASEELLLITSEDEMIKVVVKNRKKRQGLYCKYVKVTVEEVSKKEVLKYQESLNGETTNSTLGG